jgi:protein-tyrosine phosphatase
MAFPERALIRRTMAAMTHPVAPARIDWLELQGVPAFKDATGRLGMTALARALALRPEDAVDVLVLLVEDEVFVAWGAGGIASDLDGEGIRVVRHPIVDMGVPADPTAYAHMLGAIARDVRGGRTVLVSCLGGYGRSGTAIGCLLVDGGLGGDDAIEHVRAARPGAIETGAQEAFVRAWGARRDRRGLDSET